MEEVKTEGTPTPFTTSLYNFDYDKLKTNSQQHTCDDIQPQSISKNPIQQSIEIVQRIEPAINLLMGSSRVPTRLPCDTNRDGEPQVQDSETTSYEALSDCHCTHGLRSEQVPRLNDEPSSSSSWEVERELAPSKTESRFKPANILKPMPNFVVSKEETEFDKVDYKVASFPDGASNEGKGLSSNGGNLQYNNEVQDAGIGLGGNVGNLPNNNEVQDAGKGFCGNIGNLPTHNVLQGESNYITRSPGYAPLMPPNRFNEMYPNPIPHYGPYLSTPPFPPSLSMRNPYGPYQPCFYGGPVGYPQNPYQPQIYGQPAGYLPSAYLPLQQFAPYGPYPYPTRSAAHEVKPARQSLVMSPSTFGTSLGGKILDEGNDCTALCRLEGDVFISVKGVGNQINCILNKLESI